MNSYHTLVIVESPAKAKTIEKYLGDGYKVMSSIGHIRDIPKKNTDAIDIEGGFIPRYIISPGKEKVIKELQKQAKKSDTVFLASDPDREGEAIAWHVAEILKPVNTNLKRVAFNEITKEAVQEAIATPRDIDINLKTAQEARRVLDRLVGYDLSGLIWKKVRYGLSAGRVQSPALRIVMEREREIRKFIPETFYVLTALLHANTISTPFVCTKNPTTKDEAERIKKIGDTHDWYVNKIKETDVYRSPKPPFTTSTLQQTASTRLGFTPSRTMSTAQKLYESGHITYMRTDSTNLSKQVLQQLQTFIEEEYGKNHFKHRLYAKKSKSAQEAHEAIRPTNIKKTATGNSADQRELYKLIWQRTVASQMIDATLKRTKLTANVKNSNDSIPDFAVNGSRVINQGWLLVDPQARGEDTEVPKLHQNDLLELTKLDIEEKQTQPPNRYTEAGLIKELEKRGIGRPSTYASIMKTITDRGYVERAGRTLIPTDTGEVVSTFLESYFSEYISDNFTSEMENKLDDIASGKLNYTTTLEDFYNPFQKAVAEKETIEKITDLGPGPKEFPCPLCGSDMVRKLSRGGTFLSCIKFPECLGSRRLDGSEIKDAEPIGHHPETHEPIYILDGRYGPYVQLGETPEKGKKSKKTPKPRRSPIPADTDPNSITPEDALKYLTIPKELGAHPKTGEPIIANTGKFGPYIVHAGDFRSLKDPDNPYDITYERALEVLKEPKKLRKGEKLVKELGVHPKTKKLINVFESKSGIYLKKGFRRIDIPPNISLDKLTLDDAVKLLETEK